MNSNKFVITAPSKRVKFGRKIEWRQNIFNHTSVRKHISQTYFSGVNLKVFNELFSLAKWLLNKRALVPVIVKYIKSLLIHPLNSSHTQLLKYIKHKPTNIDTVEENNTYRMLTQQRPVSN